jgi:hypothetical protein
MNVSRLPFPAVGPTCVREEVAVLGGNQIEGHEKSHMISSKKLQKNGTNLKLNSYREGLIGHTNLNG